MFESRLDSGTVDQKQLDCHSDEIKRLHLNSYLQSEGRATYATRQEKDACMLAFKRKDLRGFTTYLNRIKKGVIKQATSEKNEDEDSVRDGDGGLQTESFASIASAALTQASLASSSQQSQVAASNASASAILQIEIPARLPSNFFQNSTIYSSQTPLAPQSSRDRTSENTMASSSQSAVPASTSQNSRIQAPVASGVNRNAPPLHLQQSRFPDSLLPASYDHLHDFPEIWKLYQTTLGVKAKEIGFVKLHAEFVSEQMTPATRVPADFAVLRELNPTLYAEMEHRAAVVHEHKVFGKIHSSNSVKLPNGTFRHLIFQDAMGAACSPPEAALNQQLRTGVSDSQNESSTARDSASATVSNPPGEDLFGFPSAEGATGPVRTLDEHTGQNFFEDAMEFHDLMIAEREFMEDLEENGICGLDY